MKDLIKHKVFISTFLFSCFLFFLMTIYVLDIKRNGFGVGHVEYGFPFSYFYSHCFGGYYIYEGLLGNILFATFLGITIGFIASFLMNKLYPQLKTKLSTPEILTRLSEIRQKWYF